MGTRSVTPAEVLEQGKEKTGDSSGEQSLLSVILVAAEKDFVFRKLMVDNRM